MDISPAWAAVALSSVSATCGLAVWIGRLLFAEKSVVSQIAAEIRTEIKQSGSDIECRANAATILLRSDMMTQMERDRENMLVQMGRDRESMIAQMERDRLEQREMHRDLSKQVQVLNNFFHRLDKRSVRLEERTGSLTDNDSEVI